METNNDNNVNCGISAIVDRERYDSRFFWQGIFLNRFLKDELRDILQFHDFNS